ncbi:unnamed protein product [Calypogeia fissa]
METVSVLADTSCNPSSSYQEQKNDQQTRKRRLDSETDWKGKRRIIIWSHPGSHTEGNKCNAGAKEFIEKLRKHGTDHKQWRPSEYCMRKDKLDKSCFTEAFNSIVKLWAPDPTQQPKKTKLTPDRTQQPKKTKLTPDRTQQPNRHQLTRGDLSLARLCNDLDSTLRSRHNQMIETVMAMTTSDKSKFQAVINTLTGKTVKFDKAPFVALLERKKTDSPWNQVCSLDKDDWVLVLSSGSIDAQVQPWRN